MRTTPSNYASVIQGRTSAGQPYAPLDAGRGNASPYPATLPAVRALPPVALSAAPVAAQAPHYEAGELFRRIRQISGLSAGDLARRLHTSPATIHALEFGELQLLPSWPETVVVVSGFTALAGVDPRPVLAALRVGLDANIIDVQAAEVFSPRTAPSPPRPPRPAPPAFPFSRPELPNAGKSRPARLQLPAPSATTATGWWKRLEPVAGRLGGVVPTVTNAVFSMLQPVAARLGGRRPKLPPLRPGLRMPLAVSLAVGLPLVLLASVGGASTLQAAVSSLPRPVSGVFRSVEDYVLRSMATEKNGLVWIEVRDPRTRKTDKLLSPKR